jgi:hypothetical protein
MNKKTRQRWFTWRWPLFICVASAAGLVSALLSDGWFDALGWMGLSVPVAVAGFFMMRSR